MKKIFVYLGVGVVGVILAIAVSGFIGKTPDSTIIAQQREWFGSIALKMSVVRIVVVSVFWYLATYVYSEKTASYLRTNISVVKGSRIRLLFWYFAFELVFILAYLR